jgi:hypothetical protein
VKQPCLDCGRPVEGARCQQHGLTYERSRQRVQQFRRSRGEGAVRPYDAEYRKRAAWVRGTTMVCWLCGEGARADDPWQADHVTAGDYGSELRGAHRSCNISRANKGRAKNRGDIRGGL